MTTDEPHQRHYIIFCSGLILMLALGWVGFPHVLYSTTPEPLQFNHKIHAEKAGTECASCHELRADGSFSGIPGVDNCAGCHAEAQGTTLAEKQLIEQYVKPNREIHWLVYSRQPANTRFSHVSHVKLAKLSCATCHGDLGSSSALPAYQQNRISGYSRNIYGPRMLRVGLRPGESMKMSDCEGCHASRGVSAGCLGCHQ